MFPRDVYEWNMGIAGSGGGEAPMAPRRPAGPEMFCKELAELHDYFDSRAAHRSRPNHIPAFSDL